MVHKSTPNICCIYMAHYIARSGYSVETVCLTESRCCIADYLAVTTLIGSFAGVVAVAVFFYNNSWTLL